MTSGQWYYGGADTVTLHFDSTQVPTVVLGGEQAIPCNIIGTIANNVTGESLGLNTICSPGDELVLDCRSNGLMPRTCTLTHVPDSTLLLSYTVRAVTLKVSNMWAFTPGHTVVVQMDDGTEFSSTVVSRDSVASTITIANGLPGTATTGNSVWDTGHVINRFDAIIFPAINRYWVHIEPNQPTQALVFTGNNMFNMRVTITYPTKFY